MPKKIILNEDQKKKIIELYSSGKSCRQIQDTINIGRRIISNFLKEEKLFDKNKKYDKKYYNDDIEYIIYYYQKGEWDMIFKKYPTINKQIVYKLAYENDFSAEYCKWYESDEKIVEKYMYINSFEEISKMLKHYKTPEQVKLKAYKLGYRHDIHWTNEEINILKNNYSYLPMKELMLLLPGRTRDCIYAYAAKYNLQSYYSINNLWSDIEKDFIIKNWKTMSDKELADKLNRPQRNVKWQRSRLGLFRSDPLNETNDRLNDYLRSKSYEWRKKSILSCNNKCVITGSSDFEVHHLYPVNVIISNVLFELNIENKNIGEYSEKELNLIKERFIIEQDKYLGVCVRKDIHKLFHCIYGDDSCKDKWNLFITDLKNGKYNNCITI